MNGRVMLCYAAVATSLLLAAASASGRSEIAATATVVKEVGEKTPVTYFPDLAMQFYNGERIVSEKCLNQSRLLFRDLQNLTFWASEMWDASAKQPSGFLYGSTYQLGNFDECVNPTWGSKFRPYDVTTQYCLAEISINIRPKRIVAKHGQKYNPYASILDKVWYTGDVSRLRRDLLYWALCVPASCSFKDVEALLNGYLNFTNSMSVASTAPGQPLLAYEASLGDKSCQVQTDGVTFSSRTILFFWIVGILILLSIISTMLHYHMQLKNKNAGKSDLDDTVPDAVKIFSLIRQFSKLSYSSTGNIEVLDGIRFLSICLIIVDHKFGTTLTGPITNRQTVEREYGEFHSVFFTRGDMLVDTFFAMSGLVFCLNILKHYTEKKHINVPLAILDRYIRLVPPYAFCIFLVATVYENTGNGPQWNKIIGLEAKACRQTWWIGLLMLGNYVQDDMMCMVHSWYIPCDFHFFLLALIGFVLLRNHLKYALIALSVAGVVSIIIPAAVTFYYQLPGLLLFYNDFLAAPRTHSVMSTIYVKSHNRAGAYIVGMFAGCLIYYHSRPGHERKISTKMALLLCLVGFVTMFSTVASAAIFYDTTRPYSALEASIYAGLIRPTWAFGLCLIVVSCIFGHVPFFTWFLSSPPFKVLSKLVYGMYLVHMLFQLRDLGMVRQPLYFNLFIKFQHACGDMVYSVISALFLYTLIESPSRELLRFLLKCCTPKKEVVPEINPRVENNSQAASSIVTMNNLYAKNINVNSETRNAKMSQAV